MAATRCTGRPSASARAPHIPPEGMRTMRSLTRRCTPFAVLLKPCARRSRRPAPQRAAALLEVTAWSRPQVSVAADNPAGARPGRSPCCEFSARMVLLPYTPNGVDGQCHQHLLRRGARPQMLACRGPAPADVDGHRECPKGLMATTVALCSSVHDVIQRVDRRVAPYLSWRPARSRAPRWLPTPGARRGRHRPAHARRGSLCHSMAPRPAGKHVLIAVSLAHLS